MDYEVGDFRHDVIDASAQLPVVVDFWAAWCAPCKMLGPILEQLAATAQGRWKLATVDVDAQPALAPQHQVRGIPAVKLFIDGRLVDGFSGAMPQGALVQWLDGRIPRPAQRQAAEACERPAHGRRDQARALLQAALIAEPDLCDARGLLALQALRDGDIEAAPGHFRDAIVNERVYRDDGARKACVALFGLLGTEHSRLRDWRQRLQRALH